jgi:hypothetical protein
MLFGARLLAIVNRQEESQSAGGAKPEVDEHESATQWTEEAHVKTPCSHRGLPTRGSTPCLWPPLLSSAPA